MDPRGSPQRVGDAHLADQPAYFQRNRWPATTTSRLPVPVRSEPGAMPTDDCLRLHNSQRIAHFREQPIQTNEYQSVDGTEGKLLWSSSPQNVDLLPQSPNLCLECCPRPDQIDNRPTNKPEKIPHYTTSSPDSPLPASRMRFTTGTTRN